MWSWSQPPFTSLRIPRLRLDHVELLVFCSVLVTACCVRPGALHAQVNVEVLRTDSLPLGRSGSVGGDMSIRTGNVGFIALDDHLERRHPKADVRWWMVAERPDVELPFEGR